MNPEFGARCLRAPWCEQNVHTKAYLWTPPHFFCPAKVRAAGKIMPWPPAGWTLHPDKGCIFNLEDGERGPTWWTTQAALVKDGCAVPTGVPGNYFVMGENNIKIIDVPFRAALQVSDSWACA